MTVQQSRPLRPEEEYVRACLQRVLKVPVRQYDDGTRPGMYDLDIDYPGGTVPAEITTSVDRRVLGTISSMAKVAKDGTWETPTLHRAWLLHTIGAPRLKELYATAEGHLVALEMAGCTSYDQSAHVYERIRYVTTVGSGPDAVFDAGTELLRMGVIRATSYEPETHPPLISLMPELGAWQYDGSAELLVAWVDALMADPQRADNLRKLAAAATGEAHLAVLAHMAGTGADVWRALSDDTALPVSAPALVAPITHLWLFPDPPGKTGLRWEPATGWLRFPAT